jgi:hypothetical protein
MNISVNQLLAKMEEELKHAKNSTKQERLREKVYSIKILCELLLDEKESKIEIPLQKAPAYQPVPTQQPVMPQSIIQQPVSLNQAKKIEMDDEANGDSLFDF